MNSYPVRYAALALVAVAAVVVPFFASADVSTSTYVAMIGLLLGFAFVVASSWRNAIPGDTVGQLLQRTEAARRPGRRDS
jgi:hypothetical protein